MRWRLPALIPVLAATPAPAAELPVAQPSELAVKAAFLPKFARYIELPAAARPAPGQPLTLCVAGRDPFGRLLDRAVAGENGNGQVIALRRIAAMERPDGCHLVFVQGSSELHTAQQLQAMRAHSLLTVTDFRGGRARGMVHFVMVSGRVRFQVDEAEAARRGIAISSRLLALAVDVRQR